MKRIYIKNMVSDRCKMLVKTELNKLDIQYLSIDLGEIQLKKDLTVQQCEALKNILKGSGLEILENKKSRLVESIKTTVIKMIHYTDELPKENYSVFLGKSLDHNYTYLANVFTQVEGQTIEHFIISHKIEKIKALILDNELNLTQIADLMHYSSIAHLSNQFKKVTGITPTEFKSKTLSRKQLDKV